MDASTARGLLVEARFGVLSTVDSERGTHLVPVVFAVVDDTVLVPVDRVKAKSTTRLRRVANLERDPRASLLVDHRSDDWTQLWWVRADLTFTGTDVSSQAQQALAAKYDQYANADSIQSILALEITNLTGWAA